MLFGLFLTPEARAVVPVHCPADPCRTWDIALSGDLDASAGGFLGGLLGSLGLGNLTGLIGDEREAWFVSKEAFEPTGRLLTNPFETLTGDIIKTAESLLSWDSIVWFFVKQILRNFTEGIVFWIRTGQDPFFTVGTEGSLFVTNVDKFLLAAADNQASIFLREYFGPAWDNLCKPFRLPVGKLLSHSYGRDYGSFPFKARCTISEIVDLDRYYEGFQNGGWEAWMATARYENTAWGLTTISEAESREREARAVRANQTDTLAGLGFPGLKKCIKGLNPITNKPVDNPDYDPSNPLCLESINQSPGKAVEDSLADALGQEIGKLEVADEINEIITALFDELLAWVISGGSGGTGILGATNLSSVKQVKPQSSLPSVPKTPASCTAQSGRGTGCQCTPGAQQCGPGLTCLPSRTCGPLPGSPAEICTDGIDNDGDGLIDLLDSDCLPDLPGIGI